MISWTSGGAVPINLDERISKVKVGASTPVDASRILFIPCSYPVVFYS